MSGWSQYVVDANGRGRLRWSWHTLGLFLECPQRYKHTIVDDLVQRSYMPGVSRGSCIHNALAAYYSALRVGDSAEVAEAAALVTISTDPDVDDSDRDTCERVVRSYFANYYPCEVPNEFEVVSVEQDVGVDLRKLIPDRQIPRPIIYDSRVDGIIKIKRHFEGLWVLEHKSMAALMSSTFDSYRMDGQILGEIAAARALGIPVRGVMLNALTTAQTPKFDRAFIEVGEDELRTFVESVRYWQERIRAILRRGGPWPRTYACCGRFGLCWFRDLCSCGEAVARKYVRRTDLKPGELVVRREAFSFVWDVDGKSEIRTA